jgi:probable addiction module antidote protein
MPKRTKSYRAGQLERLKNSAYAAEYINAAIEAGDNAALLLALRNVVEAQTVNAVANQAGLSRESVYRMLSETGNPCYTSLLGILGALGLQFKIQPSSRQTAEDETCAYLNWEVASPLLWEVNDCPRQYFSQGFEEFAHGFHQPEGDRVDQKTTDAMPPNTLELLDMAA